MSSAKLLWIAALVVALAGSAAAQPKTHTASPATLKAFKSDAELRVFLKKVGGRRSSGLSGGSGETMETVAVTGAVASPSITNNQEAGVDEGDIVKLRGDTLVILRRGRLFTVSLAGGGRTAVDSIAAYAPGVNARSDWYDEMLVSENRVIVIGYSYGRGGTEINRFDLDHAGHLSFRDSYHLRSNDYYSSRNYASRMIGSHLILYSPLYLSYYDSDPYVSLPAMRRWTGKENGGFARISTARQVYMAPSIPDSELDAVHSVVNCDVSQPVMACKASSVLGPSGRVFYVSASAIYVWVTIDWWRIKDKKAPTSFLYRLPLDGGSPQAIAARGAPVDQFSFREEPSRGLLTVVLADDSHGDAMWMAEGRKGPLALAYIALDSFGDGSKELDPSHYRPLPAPRSKIDDWSFHNRFVGRYLLYGFGNDWGRPEDIKTELTAVAVHGAAATQLELPHGVDRIEVMGDAGLVVGSDSRSLYFSAIELPRHGVPALGDRYVLGEASQGETRSHGFFFNPAAGGQGGIMGLPVAKKANPAYHQLFEESASVLFLRREKGKFAALGELVSEPEKAVDDHCMASCVDWYGNARPIFIGPRTFALMGYELVEGTVAPSEVKEVGRTQFAPRRLNSDN